MNGEKLCKYIGHRLQVEYPGRYWHVHVDTDNMIATIRAPRVTMDYGYQMLLDKHVLDLDAAIKKAGGEVLEMWKLPRHRLGGEQNIPRNLAGQPLQIKTGL